MNIQQTESYPAIMKQGYIVQARPWGWAQIGRHSLTLHGERPGPREGSRARRRRIAAQQVAEGDSHRRPVVDAALAAGIATYERRITALGGYGARIRATTLGTRQTLVEGTLIECGFGGCQPGLDADGRRYRIDLDSVEVQS